MAALEAATLAASEAVRLATLMALDTVLNEASDAVKVVSSEAAAASVAGIGQPKIISGQP